MAELITKSPIQFLHLPDGQVQLAGSPHVQLKVHEGQAAAKDPDWYQQLGLPMYQEQWDELATATELSGRFCRFVLADESATKHVGHWRHRPSHIRLQPARYLLTMGHTGYAIGVAWLLMVHPADRRPEWLHIPDAVEGACVTGLAELYDSGLANVSWRGLRQGIFSHTCAVIAQGRDDQEGAGELVEIALVSEPEASCPSARILKTWTA